MNNTTSRSLDVSVIIVNYNTSDLIINCLKSLEINTKGINYEVIMVDNNSEPDFIEKITEGVGIKDNFRFITLGENIGFGRANNEALKIAQGRNIFFLNPDTIICNNSIKILSDFLDLTPKAGACGGNLLDGQMNPTHSFKRELPGLSWELNELSNNILFKFIYAKNLYYNFHDYPIKVGYITGADLMVKYEVIKKVGAFSPDFFMYYEETDLCARIKKGGWDIYCIPDAKIQHLEGCSFDKTLSINNFKIEQLEKGRHLYLKKNNSNFNRKLSDFIYSLFLISRILFLKKGIKKEIYKRHKLYHTQFRANI